MVSEEEGSETWICVFLIVQGGCDMVTRVIDIFHAKIRDKASNFRVVFLLFFGFFLFCFFRSLLSSCNTRKVV